MDDFLGLFDEECIEEVAGDAIELMRNDLSGDTKVIVFRRH